MTFKVFFRARSDADNDKDRLSPSGTTNIKSTAKNDQRGIDMSEVEASEVRIRNLPPQDFVSLWEWFHEFENERCD